MLHELVFISKHARLHPIFIAFIACESLHCLHCSSIPPDRKKLSKFLNENWFGTMPPIVRQGDRFLAWLGELEGLSPERRLEELQKLPSEFSSAPWRRCKVPSCFNWFDSGTDCQRHVQLDHPLMSIDEVFESPYICGFSLPRPLGSLGLPDGPFSYCLERFESKGALQKHKESAKHKKINKQSQKKTVVPTGNTREPAAPIPIAVPAVEPNEEYIERMDVDEKIDDPQGATGSDSEALETPVERPTKRARRSDPDSGFIGNTSGRDDLSGDTRASRRAIVPLKEQFYELINSARGKVLSHVWTPEQGAKCIVDLLSSKSHVRSDSIEEEAKNYRKKIRAAETEEMKHTLFQEMISNFDNLKWV